MRIPSPPSSTQLGAAAASAGAAVAPGALLDRLEELRELIADNDRDLVRLLNRRLQLVEEIWRVKDTIGVTHVDPERERSLLRQLEESNEGPLSPRGLGVFHTTVLSLTKQELRP